MLDPLKEQLNFPAFFIYFDNLHGLEMSGIGDKTIVELGFRISPGNQAERLLHAFEPDRW